jgi:hypothetical protein
VAVRGQHIAGTTEQHVWIIDWLLRATPHAGGYSEVEHLTHLTYIQGVYFNYQNS